ncbi:hypothetical protein B0O99DRAFT_634197 [Bisporella sp. PMI_857]|nr:hypothetical protein B0O99DRAFT_634197 [Bisporella sp. PMI_857]
MAKIQLAPNHSASFTRTLRNAPTPESNYLKTPSLNMSLKSNQSTEWLRTRVFSAWQQGIGPEARLLDGLLL